MAAAAATRGRGRLQLPELPAPAGGGPAGTTPLQHFLYRSPARGQFIAPAFTTPLDNAMLQRVRGIVHFTALCCTSCVCDEALCMPAYFAGPHVYETGHWHCMRLPA